MESVKICKVCGRSIEPRKKWKKDWDQIKYCSERCRRNKSTNDYETQILDLLKARGSQKTICPSEILSAELKQNKQVMEEVRSAARRLHSEGKILILQGGHPVDPSTAKGPIRLKLIYKDGLDEK